MPSHVTLRLVPLALVLASCASPAWVPDPQPFPPSVQLVPKASKHWAMIANDIAANVKSAMVQMDSDKLRSIYVADYSPDSVFEEAFRNMLMTGLTRQGLPVTNKPQDTLRLEYQAQLVRHGSARGSAPSHEVIVSSWIESGGHHILRTTDSYYLEEADVALYAEPRVAQYPLVPVREYRVVGVGK